MGQFKLGAQGGGWGVSLRVVLAAPLQLQSEFRDRHSTGTQLLSEDGRLVAAQPATGAPPWTEGSLVASFGYRWPLIYLKCVRQHTSQISFRPHD